MKWNFLYQITAAPEPLTRGLPPPDPRSLCPQLNLLNTTPPPQAKFLDTPLSTPVGFGQGFLSKEQSDYTRVSPHFCYLVPADVYVFPPIKSVLKVWRFFLLLPSLRMRRKSRKGFHKMASRTASSTLRLLTELYASKRGLFWRKCSLNDNTLLCFSETKRFREYFEASTQTYIHIIYTFQLDRHAFWCLYFLNLTFYNFPFNRKFVKDLATSSDQLIAKGCTNDEN